MRIMAFEAHPDDVEHFCAGTLAKYADKGHQVAIVCMTDGGCGSPDKPQEEIARIREAEARRSASLIGAELFWMGYSDGFLFNSEEVRLRVIEVIREFGPELILTLDKDNDYHPDHTMVGQVVWDTHVLITVPNIKTATPAGGMIPDIYYMDTPAGINFRPEFYVDITDYIDTKLAMVRCHASQEWWCMDQYGVSLADNAELQSRFRGYQAGCQYAEAFRKPRFFPQKTSREGLLP
ncbi:MAG: PIG-L deacetylase family protein [Candidatus Zipacnadales bacterium]